jgi:hypothetical protein
MITSRSEVLIGVLDVAQIPYEEWFLEIHCLFIKY